MHYVLEDTHTMTHHESEPPTSELPKSTLLRVRCAERQIEVWVRSQPVEFYQASGNISDFSWFLKHSWTSKGLTRVFAFQGAPFRLTKS